jgi:lysophospholipase L1-like esterase
MKKAKIRLLALSLAIALLTGIAASAAAAPATAYTPLYTDKADILYALGLFKGTDKGYELDRTPTRTEALVLLVRLLGKEVEAKAGTDANPFKDVPAWADRYAVWAYSKGLTKGTSEGVFGGNTNADAHMFITFVLRALGYDDNLGDFSYDNSIMKAEEIGLIPAGSYKNGASAFYRDDCVHLCYLALTQQMKANNTTLVKKLAADGAVSKSAALQYGLLPTSYLVACIGDSFTSGYDLVNPTAEAFPAVLSKLKGTYTFTTENYGVAGVAVNNESKLSYLHSKICAESLKTKADIILVTLGANDAVWTPDMSDFSQDYKQLLEAFISLPQAPKVIVMTPPRLLGLKGYDNLMGEIVKAEIAVAGDMKLDIIDIYAFSYGMEKYSSDSVHFNAEGHRLVADYVYKELSDILLK